MLKVSIRELRSFCYCVYSASLSAFEDDPDVVLDGKDICEILHKLLSSNLSHLAPEFEYLFRNEEETENSVE